MTQLLELEDVSVSYGGVRALSGISFSVPEGCVVALLGPNGAGKSTTLRTISGLVRAESGTITFAGEPIDRAAPSHITRRGILDVPEGRGIFPSLTVRENLLMADYALHMAANAVEEGSRLFPALASRLEQLAGTLSGGEQQMLALARALMMRPRLLMLDEISMGLAPLIVNQLFDSVRELAERGVTILLVEQYVEAALDLADYAYVLDKGRVADVGEPGDLREAGLASTYMGGGG
ncbi:MAG TPA: ABC transporter ATP-binding protein [Acidimicrobiales bacterium]|nr:ABC transporter ATP-binding protein [Acidimicrobiales bacterium]